MLAIGFPLRHLRQGLQGLFYPGRRHRHLVESNPDSIKNSIAYHRSYNGNGRFPSPLWRIGRVLNEDCLNLRQPGKTGYIVSIKIVVNDLTTSEADALVSGI